MTLQETTLSAQQAAEKLGISKVTLIRWIQSGKLPAYRPGHCYKIPDKAVEDLLEQSKMGKW
ncbi:MAG: helix-turn-helix domain-containing protein [Thermoleophilia bacterium]